MTAQIACFTGDVGPASALKVELNDICTHGAVSLSEGEVEGCLIECWLHGSQFDLRTGQPTSPPAMRPVAVYPLTVEGEHVLVDIDSPLSSS